MTKYDLTKELTILITTKDRHFHLARLFDYAKAEGFRFKAVVLDSSEENLPVFQKEILDGFGATYLRFQPDIGLMTKIHESIKHITTPYAAIWADDDFIHPASMLRCLRFLRENLDYSCCQGSFLEFFIEGGYVTTLRRLYTYGFQVELHDSTPAARLATYLIKYFPTFYALQRKEVFDNLKIFLDNFTHTEFIYQHLSEIGFAIVSLMSGKYKGLPDLYCAREDSPSFNNDRLTRPCLSVLELSSNEEHRAVYTRFLNALETVLIKTQGMSEKTASTTVELAMLAYLKIATPLTYHAMLDSDPGIDPRQGWAAVSKHLGDSLANAWDSMARNIAKHMGATHGEHIPGN